MSKNSRKCEFEIVTSSCETAETTQVKTKLEWTKYMFCQNHKLEKIITTTECNKQGTSKNTFQRIEGDLRKFQEAGFRDVNLDIPSRQIYVQS